MKNCIIFFDITKAFDKIWHNGVLFKLIKNNFDKYIIKWIAELLKNRSYVIKINSSVSEKFDIEVGAPQGGVLSIYVLCSCSNLVQHLYK